MARREGDIDEQILLVREYLHNMRQRPADLSGEALETWERLVPELHRQAEILEGVLENLYRLKGLLD